MYSKKQLYSKICKKCEKLRGKDDFFTITRTHIPMVIFYKNGKLQKRVGYHKWENLGFEEGGAVNPEDLHTQTLVDFLLFVETEYEEYLEKIRKR